MYPSFNARAVGLTLPTIQTIEIAARSGFVGVDLMVRDMIERESLDSDEIRMRMDDLGVRGGAFPLPFDWRGDEERFARDLARLPMFAEAAATLGLRRTGTWVMPETPFVDGLEPQASDRDRTFALHVDRLARIARILAAQGIEIGLEVIGVASSRTGRGLPFIHRLEAVEPLRAAIEAVAEQPIGLLVDSWHLYAAGESVDDALASAKSARVVWVHVADVHAGANPDPETLVDAIRGLPGESGLVDSRGLLAALAQRGYDGPVTAEPLGSARSLAGLSPESTARTIFESIKSVWPVA